MFIFKLCRLKDGSFVEVINFLIVILWFVMLELFVVLVLVKQLLKKGSWYELLKNFKY